MENAPPYRQGTIESLPAEQVVNMARSRRFLTRRRTRDIILLCCFVSAFAFRTGRVDITIGFVLLSAGVLFHVIAKGALIRNTVLCNKGIYGIVRHPYYLANYLIDSGFCVLSGNLYLLLAYPFLFFWCYGPTLRKEEKFLADGFGQAYHRDAFALPQVFPDSATRYAWGSLFEGFSLRRVSLKEYSRITKFYSLAFVVALIHNLKLGWVEKMRSLYQPSLKDYDECLFLAGAILLFVASSLITKMRRRGLRET